MCWLVPKNLQNTIPSYSSVYVRLSEGNADPLKASQETSRTHWKDICGVEVDPQRTWRKVRGHFCLSRVLSVQLSFCLSLSTFVAIISLSLGLCLSTLLCTFIQVS